MTNPTRPILNCTCANTDNKVHLFVTVFANRSYYQDKSCYMTDPSRTTAFNKASTPGQFTGRQDTLYRDTRTAQTTPTWTAKTRAMASVPTVTIDRLKNNLTCPDGRRPTQTHFIAGPLALIVCLSRPEFGLHF